MTQALARVRTGASGADSINVRAHFQAAAVSTTSGRLAGDDGSELPEIARSSLIIDNREK